MFRITTFALAVLLSAVCAYTAYSLHKIGLDVLAGIAVEYGMCGDPGSCSKETLREVTNVLVDTEVYSNSFLLPLRIAFLDVSERF